MAVFLAEGCCQQICVLERSIMLASGRHPTADSLPHSQLHFNKQSVCAGQAETFPHRIRELDRKSQQSLPGSQRDGREVMPFTKGNPSVWL